MLNYLSMRVLAVVTLTLITLGGDSVGAEPQSEQEPCQLVIGWHHWPPFQHLDAHNQPVGFQIELAKKLAAMVNCEASFLLQTFEQNQQSIIDGKIDLVFDITPTRQRKQYGYFSIPYRREMYVLYVWPEDFEKCRGSKLDDLIANGFQLILNDGVIYGKDILEVQKNESLNRLIQYEPSNARLLNLFIEKRVDGMVEDPMVMAFNKRAEKRLKKIKACHISVNTELVSIMFSQKTTDLALVKRFNKAIEKLKKEPGYLQIWGI